jgi:hypothetical protein
MSLFDSGNGGKKFSLGSIFLSLSQKKSPEHLKEETGYFYFLSSNNFSRRALFSFSSSSIRS